MVSEWVNDQHVTNRCDQEMYRGNHEDQSLLCSGIGQAECMSPVLELM